MDKKPFWEDEANYALVSNYIFNDFFSNNYNPVYDTNLVIYPQSFFYLNALGQFMLGNNEFGNRFFTALFGSLTFIPIFLIGKKFFNEKVGILAAFLTTFSPEHIAFSRENLPFIVPMFFFLAAFYFLLSYFQSSKEKQKKFFFLSLIFILVSFSFHFLLSAFFIILIPIIAKLYKKKFSSQIYALIVFSILLFSLYCFRYVKYWSHDFKELNDFFTWYSDTLSLTKNLTKILYLIYENYLDAKYLFIPLILTSLIFFSIKKIKKYKNSLLIISILFFLTFFLTAIISNPLESLHSFPFRLHIFFSYIIYLVLGFSLFLLSNTHKKIFLAIFILLLILFSFHIIPLLEKKIISINENFSSINLFETKSIVCSEKYYSPLNLYKFINAFLFCFSHHPIYYDDALDWKEPVMVVENATEKNTQLIIFSSHLPITSYYFQQSKINNNVIVYKDLHCNYFLPFCSKEKLINISSELFVIERARSRGANIKIFFLIDKARYEWQLTEKDKELLISKCSKYENDFIIYNCY